MCKTANFSEDDDSYEDRPNPEGSEPRAPRDERAKKSEAQKKADEIAKRKSALPEFLARHFVDDSEEPEGATLEIFRRLKAGDPEAGNDIVRRFQDRLLRYVRIRMRLKRKGLNESMDYVQNTFAKFFKGLEDSEYEYRGQGSLFAYLKKIADFLVLSDGRLPPINQLQNNDEVLDLMHSLADPANAPEETTTQRELREIMDNSVLELADNFREVILFRFYLMMPAVEVAEQMGYSKAQSVHALYHNALEAWRVVLEPRVMAWLKDD